MALLAADEGPRDPARQNAREERAASFIQQFMPQTAPGSLTTQEAYDLSAFINSHPRPDSPMKEKDWPNGGAPKDVPYATQGREAYNPPPLLERTTSAAARSRQRFRLEVLAARTMMGEVPDDVSF